MSVDHVIVCCHADVTGGLCEVGGGLGAGWAPGDARVAVLGRGWWNR